MLDESLVAPRAAAAAAAAEAAAAPAPAAALAEALAAAAVVAPAPAPAPAAAPGVMREGRRGALKRQKTRAQLSDRLEQMQLSLPTATPGFGEDSPRASVPRVPR